MLNEQRIIYLNPRDLAPSRRNVRSDPGDLAGLAETIREHGILQPLGVTPDGDGYRVVYGNRRREAAIVVGLDRVPCLLIEQVNEEEAMLRQVLENLQRLDLNDLDKSLAFENMQRAMSEHGLTQAESLEMMAYTLGLSTRQIQRYLRLRQLSPAVQQRIAQGELGVTHGQHLMDVSPRERQEATAELVVEESLSAAELARLVAALERNANIAPRLALERLRRGEHIAIVESKPREPLPQFGGAPAQEAQEAAGEEPYLDDEAGADERKPDPRRALPTDDSPQSDYGYLEPGTRDGNRVRKIHSLDAFMDELQRLTSCLQEGDFQRFLGDDEASTVKVRLAARQLRFLADAVAALVKAGESAKGESNP
jgi:ParB family chromosome partitioning protein